jgi:hypothetical protein
VLIAVVDQGWAEIVVTESRVLTRLALRVRNTQRQFVRVTLPVADASVWSVVVGGVATKPSRDKDGPILVPLVKSGGGAQENFWVEIVYMTSGLVLGRRGTIQLQMPELDMPINHMCALLFLPNEYASKDGEGQSVWLMA